MRLDTDVVVTTVDRAMDDESDVVGTTPDGTENQATRGHVRHKSREWSYNRKPYDSLFEQIARLITWPHVPDAGG